MIYLLLVYMYYISSKFAIITFFYLINLLLMSNKSTVRDTDSYTNFLSINLRVIFSLVNTGN